MRTDRVLQDILTLVKKGTYSTFFEQHGLDNKNGAKMSCKWSEMGGDVLGEVGS